MATRRGTIWRLAAQDLQWRSWDDQLVVYHPASGDTHLLHPVAGQLLDSLAHAPADTDALTTQLAPVLEAANDKQGELLEQLERLLVELERLGLVEVVRS